jgi:hypothetical protein
VVQSLEADTVDQDPAAEAAHHPIEGAAPVASASSEMMPSVLDIVLGDG